MKTAAVLFDMDGVLVDSEPIINAAAIRALAEFGVTARPEDFEPFVGAGENRYVGGVAELHGKVFIPEMKYRTYDWYLKLLPSMGKAFPGARDLVEHLHRLGIACAVASSADSVKVEANLTTMLQVPLDRFGAIVTGEEVTRRKPHPDIFLEAGASAEYSSRGLLRDRGCGEWRRGRQGRGDAVCCRDNEFPRRGPLSAVGAGCRTGGDTLEVTLADLGASGKKTPAE